MVAKMSDILSAAGPALPPEQPVIGSQTEPKQPNMSEIIANRFIQYGEVGAKALENLGKAAIEDACKFNDECQHNARILRQRAMDKANDTSWYIQQMRAFHDLAKEEPRLKAQVASAGATSSEGTDAGRDTSDGANHDVLPDGERHKPEV